LPVIFSKPRASARQRFNCLYRCAFPRLAGGRRADPGQGRPGVCRWRSRPDGGLMAAGSPPPPVDHAAGGLPGQPREAGSVTTRVG